MARDRSGLAIKILIFLNNLGIDLDAVPLRVAGAALRDVYGHDVVLYGTPRAMVKLAEDKRWSPSVRPCDSRNRI